MGKKQVVGEVTVRLRFPVPTYPRDWDAMVRESIYGPLSVVSVGRFDVEVQDVPEPPAEDDTVVDVSRELPPLSEPEIEGYPF